MRRRLRDPKSGLRKTYVRLLVDQVVVGEGAIVIRGSEAALTAATMETEAVSAGEVPSSVQEWRCRQSQANPSPPVSLLIRENTGNLLIFRLKQAL